MEMEIEYSSQQIDGPKLILGVRHFDNRGFFSETYQLQRFTEHGLPVFVQDNLSSSSKGVFRGLHWQSAPFPQGKLVTCLAGEIIDFFVDIRPESPTFGQHGSVRLSSEALASLWIPNGFAHGFLSLANDTLVSYKVSGFWNPESERSLNPMYLAGDKNFDLLTEKIMSNKDLAAPHDIVL